LDFILVAAYGLYGAGRSATPKNCPKLATKNGVALTFCTAAFLEPVFFAPRDQSVVAVMSSAHDLSANVEESVCNYLRGVGVLC
jgi:hypothetical protein